MSLFVMASSPTRGWGELYGCIAVAALTNINSWASLKDTDKSLDMARESLACDVCAVRGRAACAALDQADRKQLAKLGHHQRLKRGEIRFAAGDRNDMSATLIEGLLKLSSFDEDGTEHIVSLIHPAGFVGELFAPVARYDVIALTDCELCVFPRREYEQALRRFPELGRALLKRSSQDLSETRLLLAAVTGRTAIQRVAGFLLALARAASDSECHPAREFDPVLTRGEIAALLGLTIETVSRQLTALEQDGTIRRKGARMIELRDAARLGAFAG
jgi:CRP/FNR family transcriptional regulator